MSQRGPVVADKRSYQESHPWIAFDVKLGAASPIFWMLLGEARSKCDHIKYVPLSADTARALHFVYFAKGVNATTAIEGNSLSEEQVQARVKGQLKLPVSKEYLGTEIDNMIGAYNSIIASVERGEAVKLSIDTLQRLNKEILASLDLDPNVVAGELRQHNVVAGSYVAAPWSDVPYLLDRLCEWMDTGFEAPDESQRIPYAFIKAVTAHVYIEWIHPFGDGNGRLGRLVEFLVLISQGVPLPAAHVLTSHYNDTRTEYYRQLNNASRNGGDLRDFLRYAAQGFVDGLTEAIKRLHTQQEQLMWTALVDEAYIHRHTAAAHRQRLLAIELGKHRDWVRRAAITTLAPSLTEEYAGKTTKTITRDINRLRELGFIRPDGSGGLVGANLSLVRGMRPLVVSDDE